MITRCRPTTSAPIGPRLRKPVRSAFGPSPFAPLAPIGARKEPAVTFGFVAMIALQFCPAGPSAARLRLGPSAVSTLQTEVGFQKTLVISAWYVVLQRRRGDSYMRCSAPRAPCSCAPLHQ